MQSYFTSSRFLRTFFVLSFFFLTISANAQVPSWHWVKTSKPCNNISEFNIGKDASGNVYVLNQYRSNAQFADFAIHNSNDAVILSKHNTNGYLEFAKELKGIEDFFSMTTDPNGNTIVVGSFDEHITIDTTNLYGSTSDGNLFVAKYNNHGDFLWVKTLRAQNSFIFYKELCVDANGNIYLNVTSKNGFTIVENDTLQSTGSCKPYLLTVKLDAGGNVKWLKPLFTSGNRESYNIAVDKNENVYIGGYHADSLFSDAQGQYIANTNSYSSFIAKRDKNGNLLWVKNITCNPDWSMATSDQNDLFIYGVFEDSFSFNQIRIQSGKDYFLLKCDSAGNNVWCKTVRDKDYVDFRYGLAIDKAGNAYTLGTRSDTLTVGNIFFSSRGGHDYLVKYDRSGNAVWGHSFNNAGVSDICVDYVGNLLVTGRISGKDSLGNIVLNSVVDGNTFVGKFSDQTSNSISSARSAGLIYVYPNPSSDIFTLNLNGNNYKQLIITDQLGRIVSEQKITDEKFVQLYLDNAANGIYNLKVIGGSASQMIKLQLNR